jgi:type IV pilus assembly protein PilC
MPYFICRMAGENGTLLTRSLLASSADECRKLIESEGYCVLSVRRDWKKIQIRARVFGDRIREGDFILFNQELIALLRSGHPILKSVEVIAGRMKSLPLKELLLKVEADVRSGKSLSEAFAPHEDRFSKVYTASLMAGERSGNLPGTIGRFVQYAKILVQTKSKIRAATIYPTLLLIFSAALIGVLITFVLPRFASFYADFQAEMPGITTMLISLSLAVRRNLFILLLLAAVLALAVLRLKKREEVRIAWDRLKLRIPFGRVLWRDSAVALFSRTLGLLLEAGISLLSAIGVASQAVPNRFLLRRLSTLPDAIKNGQSLTDSLTATAVFPGMALDMIRIGETSANLPGMLSEVADFYDERIRARIDTLVSLIEPVIIIFMGLLVAGMLVSVYLPIFNIIRVAR